MGPQIGLKKYWQLFRSSLWNCSCAVSMDFSATTCALNDHDDLSGIVRKFWGPHGFPVASSNIMENHMENLMGNEMETTF